MMANASAFPLTPGVPIGTGGFLDPDRLVDGFGVEKGMIISDFGCGAGYFTISMAEKTGSTGKVYAFDVQTSALDHVKSKARVRGIDNIETVRTNLEIPGSSGLADESQDIVLLANILFQSQKKSEIIKEGFRVLKKGGKMIIIDWKKGAGSFGPPTDHRTEEKEMIQFAEKEGLAFEHPVDAGQFHYGLLFKKK